MRHALLTLALAAASTAAYASLWPFSVFTDDASVSAVRTQVTSNGVTRTRLGDLYRDNLVVTDVDLSSVKGTITNIVAGDNIVIDDPAPGVKRISAVGRGGGGRELDDMTVWVRTNGTEFVDTGDRLATTGQVGKVMTFLESHEEYADTMFDVQSKRLSAIIQQQGNLNNRVTYTVEPAIEDVSNRMRSCERKVADLVYEFGSPMPVDECLKYASLGIPAIKCTLATGNTALFVLCEGGVYFDASKVKLPFSADGPVKAVRDMLGWTFTRADLYRTFGDSIIWTSDFTPTGDNLVKPVSQVCGGIGYPKYYGRESTAFELLCDILATDRKAVLRGDPYLTYQTNSVKFANLRAVSEQLYDYSAAAHSAVLKMRSKVDGIQAPDYSMDNEELVDTISEVYSGRIEEDIETLVNEVMYPSDDLSVEWANEYTDDRISALSADVRSKLSGKQDALPFTTDSYTNEQGTVVTLTNYAISVEYAADAGSAGYAYWSEGIFDATNDLYASGEIVTITNLDTLASVTNRIATEAHVAMKLSAKADRADSDHADELATLDDDGNPKASGINADDIITNRLSKFTMIPFSGDYPPNISAVISAVNKAFVTDQYQPRWIGSGGLGWAYVDFSVTVGDSLWTVTAALDPSLGQDAKKLAPAEVSDGSMWFYAVPTRTDIYEQIADKADRSMISATDPTFSNAVVNVRLPIGYDSVTNAVAMLDDFKAAFGDLGTGDIVGGAGTIGTIILALIGAVAWLKKNKLNSNDPVLTPVAPSSGASSTALAGAKATGEALAGKLGKGAAQGLGSLYWDGNTLTAVDGAEIKVAQWNTGTNEDVSVYELRSSESGPRGFCHKLTAKSDRSAFAPEYSASTTYAVGDFVWHNGVIYQCDQAGKGHTPTGATTDAYWHAAKLDDFFKANRAALLPPAFAAKTSGSYEQGELVTYNGVAYKRNATSGADTSWVSSHWTAASDADLAARLKCLKNNGFASDDFAADLLGKSVAISAVNNLIDAKIAPANSDLEDALNGTEAN